MPTLEHRNPNDLTPYHANPRRNDKAVDAVAASISDFGFQSPIIVDSDGVIIAGHTRHKAALKLGLEQVPVIVADLSPDKARALRLADNKVSEIATWDESVLEAELAALAAAGIEMADYSFSARALAEIDAGLDTDGDDDQETPADSSALDAIPKRANLGDIWQLGDHRLAVGDSLDHGTLDRLVDGATIDALITDPPYGISYEGGTKDKLTIANDQLRDTGLLAFLSDAFANAARVLKPGGAYYLWHAETTRLEFQTAAEAHLGAVRQTLIWVKDNATLGRQDYQWQHEPALYGWADDPDASGDEDYQHRHGKAIYGWRDGGPHYFAPNRAQTTVLYANKPSRNALHPTMKPVPLMKQQVTNSTRRGENVLDLFAGSGSTMLACEETGRACYAVELDPRFADVIIERWEALTGQTAERK